MDVYPVSRSYDAYGGSLASVVGTRSAYAGQVGEIGWDAYVLGQRLYVACLRRFVSADGLSPFGAGGLNRYAYCGGDPINRVDPKGSAFGSWLSDLVRWIGNAVQDAQSATVSTVAARLAGTLDTVSTHHRTGMPAGPLGAVATGRGHPVFGNLGRATGPHGLNPGRYWIDRRDLRGGRTVVQYTFTADAVSSTTLAERGFRRGRDLVTRRSIQYIKPMWTPVPNGAGGYVYLSDSVTTNHDVLDLVEELAGPSGNPGKDISVLFGAHGEVGGDLNWRRSPTGLFRAGGDPGLGKDFDRFWPEIQNAVTGRRVSRYDMGGMTPVELYSHMKMNEIIIYSTCYGASDVEVMAMFNLFEADVFKLI